MIKLSDLQQMSRQDLIELSQKTDWYHVINLGDDVLTNGTFDIRPELDKYNIPRDLSGKSVLDIGRASGFFSFEFERRGADVTATDLPSPLDKDYVGGTVTRQIMRDWFYDTPLAGEDTGGRLDFFIAHILLKSKVKSRFMNIMDMSPSEFEPPQFDIVFIGSLLNHVRDPVGALCRALSVCRELCIVANPYDTAETSTMPKMRLVGRSAASLTTWWLPNIPCLVEMMYCAGFDHVDVVSRDVILKGRHQTGSIPHAVLHARVPSAERIRQNFEGILKRWKPDVSPQSKFGAKRGG